MTAALTLPKGYVWDEPETAAPALPEGFVWDEPAREEESAPTRQATGADPIDVAPPGPVYTPEAGYIAGTQAVPRAAAQVTPFDRRGPQADAEIEAMQRQASKDALQAHYTGHTSEIEPERDLVLKHFADEDALSKMGWSKDDVTAFRALRLQHNQTGDTKALRRGVMDHLRLRAAGLAVEDRIAEIQDIVAESQGIDRSSMSRDESEFFHEAVAQWTGRELLTDRETYMKKHASELALPSRPGVKGGLHDIGVATTRGVASVLQGIGSGLRGYQQLSEKLPPDPIRSPPTYLAGLAGGPIEQLGDWIEEHPNATPSFETATSKPQNLRWWATNFSEQAPQLATMIAAGTLAGPMAAMGLIGTLEGGHVRKTVLESLLDQGMGREEAEMRANLAGAAAGVVNGLIEALPFKEFVGRNQAIRNVLIGAVRGMAIEGGTEGVQELVAYGAERAAGVPADPDIAYRIFSSVAIGAGLGGGLGGAGTAVRGQVVPPAGQVTEPPLAEPTPFTPERKTALAPGAFVGEVQAGLPTTEERLQRERTRAQGIEAEAEEAGPQQAGEGQAGESVRERDVAEGRVGAELGAAEEVEPWEMTQDEYKAATGYPEKAYTKGVGFTREYHEWADTHDSHETVLRKAINQGKTISPRVVDSLPPGIKGRLFPETTGEAPWQQSQDEFEQGYVVHGTNLLEGEDIGYVEPRVGDFTREMYGGSGATEEMFRDLAYFRPPSDVRAIEQYAEGVRVFPKKGKPYILVSHKPGDAQLVTEEGIVDAEGDVVSYDVGVGPEPGDIISEEGAQVLYRIPLDKWRDSGASTLHEYFVKQAIAEGKITSHPDYPDLTEQPSPPSASPAAKPVSAPAPAAPKPEAPVETPSRPTKRDNYFTAKRDAAAAGIDVSDIKGKNAVARIRERIAAGKQVTEPATKGVTEAPVVPPSAEPLPPSTEQPAGKEPWEMTEKEYVSAQLAEIPSGRRAPTGAQQTGRGRGLVAQVTRTAKRSYKNKVEQAAKEGKAVPTHVLEQFRNKPAWPFANAALAKSVPEQPSISPNLPQGQVAGNAVTAIDEALERGDTDEGTARLARHLVTDVDPSFDANSSIEISNAVIEATPDMVAAEGLPEGTRATATGRTETLYDVQDAALHTTVSLLHGHDADTVVEEWYHRAYDRLSPQDKRRFNRWHKNSGDLRTAPEHFAQGGRDFFFSEKLHEGAGPIRELFAKARESLRALIGRIRTIRGMKLPAAVERMWREAGEESGLGAGTRPEQAVRQTPESAVSPDAKGILPPGSPWGKATAHQIRKVSATVTPREGVTEVRVYEVSVQPKDLDGLTDKEGRVKLKTLAQARRANANPERVKDWQDIYAKAERFTAWSDSKKVSLDSKIKDVPVVALTIGCGRATATVERVTNGILAPETHIEACYEGFCWANKTWIRKFSDFENMETKDIRLADPKKIEGWLTKGEVTVPAVRERDVAHWRKMKGSAVALNEKETTAAQQKAQKAADRKWAKQKNKEQAKPPQAGKVENLYKVKVPALAWLKSFDFIRQGQKGDDSHLFATGIAKEWLRLMKKYRVNKKTVFISSGYAPVTQAQYEELAPYSKLFEIHFSVSGWFSENENMMRLAEFNAAKRAGLPVNLRVITNKDNVTDLMMPNEDFLFRQMRKMKVPQGQILETPYHDDETATRSEPTGVFKFVCCEKEYCSKCGVDCMIKKSTAGSVSTSWQIRGAKPVLPGKPAKRTRQEISERAALRRRLQTEARVSGKAYTAGQQELVQTHEALLDRVESTLSAAEAGEYMRRIVAARTPGQLNKLGAEIEHAISMVGVPSPKPTGALVPESDALKYAMKKAQVTSAAAYLAGGRDVVQSHKELVDYAKSKLPKGEQGPLLRLIAKARTPAQLRDAMASVDILADHYAKQSAVQGVKKAYEEMKSAKLRPEFRALADELFEEYTLDMPTEKTLRRMESLLKAEEVDFLQEIPQQLVERAQVILAKTDKKLIRDLEVDEIWAVASALESIVRQNIQKNQMLAGREGREHANVNAEATKEVEAYNPERTKPGKSDPNAFIRFFTWGKLNLDTLTTIVAGADSTAKAVIHGALSTSQGKFLKVQRTAKKAVTAKLAELGLSRKDARKWSHALGGRKFHGVTVELPTATDKNGKRVTSLEMSHGERIELAGLANDSNRRAEMIKNKAQGVTFSRTKRLGGGLVKLRLGDIYAIEDSLTPLEREIMQFMQDYVNTDEFQELINATARKVFGINIANRKDYWWSRRDGDYLKTDPNAFLREWHENFLEDQNFTKKRQRSDKPFVIGDAFAGFFSHVNRVAAFSAKTTAVQDARRLLRDIDFMEAVRTRFKHGDAILKTMESAISDFAGVDVVPPTLYDRLARGMIRRAHRGALALKPQIVAYQTVSVVNATEVVPVKYMFNPKTVGTPARNKATRAEIDIHSDTMASRLEGGGHQILTPQMAGLALEEFYFPGQTAIEQATMGPIHWADSQVMYQIWRAAKLQGQDQGLTGDTLMEFVAHQAELTVQRTQPTWDALSTSEVQRWAKKHPITRLIPGMLFSSQRSKNTNMVAWAWSEFSHSEKTARDYAHLVRRLSIPTILNATLIYGWQAAIRSILGWASGDDDERGYFDHIEGVLERLFGNWVVAGDLVTLLGAGVRAGLEGKQKSWKTERRNILGQAATEGVESVALIVKAISEAVGDETYDRVSRRGERYKHLRGDPKWPITAWKATEKALRAIGIFAGLPFSGALQLGRPYVEPEREKKRKAG